MTTEQRLDRIEDDLALVRQQGIMQTAHQEYCLLVLKPTGFRR